MAVQARSRSQGRARAAAARLRWWLAVPLSALARTLAVSPSATVALAPGPRRPLRQLRACSVALRACHAQAKAARTRSEQRWSRSAAHRPAVSGHARSSSDRELRELLRCLHGREAKPRLKTTEALRSCVNGGDVAKVTT
jgi:hypothetical protein